MSTAEALAPPSPWWPFPITEDFQPRAFQLDGIREALHPDRRGHMFDVGLGGGKTTMSLAVAEVSEAKRVLVVCPSKVVAVWPEEVNDHAVRDWTVWSGQVLGAHGRALKNPSVPRRCESLIQANTAAIRLGRPFMAVVNYEAVVRDQMFELLLGTPWDLVILDESHKIASAQGTQSKRLARVCKRVRSYGGRVIAQTGTSMPHSGLSLFGQFRAIDDDVLGTSWTTFKNRYAKYRVVNYTADGEPIYQTTVTGQRIPDGVDPAMEAELMARVRPYVTRVSQAELDEVTGLHQPPASIRTVPLDPETRRVYDSLEKDLVAEVADGTITAANAMVNVLRLAQVTSGYGVDEFTGQPIAITDVPEKARLLATELEDLDVREPVVVVARFHHDLDQIRLVAEAQGRRYGEISGRRSDGLQGHRMSPFVDVVGVQPQSGGAGVNLTRARLLYVYSTDFSLANIDQVYRRILRQGQTRLVSYVHLVCEETIDRAIFGALKRRRDVNDGVLAYLKDPKGALA